MFTRNLLKNQFLFNDLKSNYIKSSPSQDTAIYESGEKRTVYFFILSLQSPNTISNVIYKLT